MKKLIFILVVLLSGTLTVAALCKWATTGTIGIVEVCFALLFYALIPIVLAYILIYQNDAKR